MMYCAMHWFMHKVRQHQLLPSTDYNFSAIGKRRESISLLQVVWEGKGKGEMRERLSSVQMESVVMELQISFLYLKWEDERKNNNKKNSLNVVLFLSSNSFFQIPCNIGLHRLHVPYDWVWVGSGRECAPSLLDSFALQRSLSNRHLHAVFHSRKMDRVCIYQCVYWCSKCQFHSLDPAWVKNLTKQKQQHPNSVWGGAWSWCAEEHLSCPQKLSCEHGL